MGFDRFWRGYDWVARADLAFGWVFDWRNWLWSFVPGGGGITLVWAYHDNWTPLNVWIAAVGVAAGVAIVVYVVISLLEKRRAYRVDEGRGDLLRAPLAETKAVPDIDPREAFFQILESSEWRKEQDRTTTDTTHLVRDWREVRLNKAIHDALRNSRLDAWGEECLPGTATTPEKPIPPTTWDKVEIAFNRTALPHAAAHFKGRTSRELGAMAWVAVKFSRAQIFNLFPLASTNDYRPICEAIKHISERTTDDAAKFWPATRLALRQAAYDKRVKVRGRKQLPENNPHTGNEYSELLTDVDSSYWTTSEINVLATSADNQSMYHTDPQTAFAWGRQGIYERNRYVELKINWADVLKEWP